MIPSAGLCDLVGVTQFCSVLHIPHREHFRGSVMLPDFVDLLRLSGLYLIFAPLPCVSRLHCKTVSMLTVLICDFIVETAQVVSFKFWNSTRCSKTFLYLTPCLAQCALHSLTLPLFASIGIEHHLEWRIAISSIGLVVGWIVMQKCLAETGGNKSKLTSRDYIKFEQSYLDPKVDASWSHFLHTGSLI